MKTSLPAQNYSLLTPEERFHLILAASGRGDEVEKTRLVRAGDRIKLSMPDHAPWANAFNDLALLEFIELLEEAAGYINSFHPVHAKEQEEDDEDDGKQSLKDETKMDETIQDGDVTLALGYILRAKAEGWKLFCEKLNIPPFLYWEDLPGFKRLQIALDIATRAAFTPEGIVKWLNRVRKAGEPELAKPPLSADRLAAELEKAYRQRAQWWGGESPS